MHLSVSSKGVNPQEEWDQSCTSVVIWLVFSLISLLASEHRWRIICCLLPLDSFSFSIPIPPPPQELACQQKPCTSLRAYQTVYPFPVGTVLHLWLSQPIAAPRIHSKLRFRRSALPELLKPIPLSHDSFFSTCNFLGFYNLPFIHTQV